MLRQWAEHWAIRILLVPLLVWSSLLLAVFHQTAIIDQFISAPWAAYFVVRMAHTGDVRWRNWTGLALSIGTAWQSYYFAGVWILVLFLGAGFLLFRRPDLGHLIEGPMVWRKAAVTALLIVVMALPNVVVLAERANWVFPARMLDHSYVGRPSAGGPLQYEPPSSLAGSDSVFMSYGAVQYTGTFSSPWDFLQLLTPEGNTHARGERAPLTFGRPSEAFMYVGLLGYVVALWGLAAGQHPLKRVWLLTTVGFGLLMLGPSGGLYWLLRVYPPLWVVRHTHVFASFFVLGLLFFFTLGCNRLVQGATRLPRSGGRWALEVLACWIVVVLSAALFLRATSASKRLPAVNWEVALVVVPLLVLILMRRRLGAVGLCLAVLGAHLVLIFSHTRTSELLRHLTIFLIVPALFLLSSSRGGLSRYRRWALLAAAVFLLVDLGLYVSRSSWLWHWERPDRVLHVSPFPAPPRSPAVRQAVLPSQYLYEAYPQPIRYLSLVFRKPAAFSSLMYTGMQPEAFFRSVPVSLSVPGWSHGGEARMRPEPSESSVSIPITRTLRDQRLWIQVWVKSSTTVADSVRVEAVFGNERVSRFYGNSGEWERLTIDGLATSDVVTVGVRVLESADAPAVVDRLALRVSPGREPAPDFDPDLVRRAARWNTFIVPARYFDLVHADLPIEALSEILTLGASPIQFRPDAQFVSATDLPAHLRDLGAQASRRLLARSVLLDTHSADKRPLPAPAFTGEPRIVVRDYEYNTLRLTIEAPTPGYLYIADGFDPSWRALVDGRSRPVVPANMAFKAVSVEAGRHEIRLEYRPIRFQIALAAYFLVFGLGLCVLLAALFRQRN